VPARALHAARVTPEPAHDRLPHAGGPRPCRGDRFPRPCRPAAAAQEDRSGPACRWVRWRCNRL